MPFIGLSQTDKNICSTLLKINTLIKEKHYKPKPIDDSLSVYVFNKFIDELDSDNSLFLSGEINSLKKYQYTIDDAILSGNCGFLNDIYKTYLHTIDRYQTNIATIKKEPPYYSSTEFILFSKKSFPYMKTEAELKTLYKKRILFDILKDITEISKNKDSLIANFNTIAPKSRVKIFENFECKTDGFRMSQKDFNSKFINCYCSYFDPHTEYFSESEKSSFLSSVSADNLTFGLYLSVNEKNEVAVDDIIPGSSAYFTQKVEAGDVLVKIKSKDEEYNVGCSSLDKIEEIIGSDEYKIADFTLKKKSGENYTINLIKKVMKDYQNNVYSYILEKDGKKTGYIKIPSFYATFENGKTNVSDDVAKEIYKLQEDKIDGLIIDLENNGGGSMEEAIKLSGLFIDAGPVAILNDKNNKNEILKDVNRGAIYNGPMVVLINGFSASASEFFANAMQDYNRAIIVGTTSFGKATMQQIFPIDNSKEPNEFLKITLEKFYRITGKSNQYTGIKPDVEIPSIFEKQMPREDDEKTALKNDILTTNLKFKRIETDYSKTIEASKKRVLDNIEIKKISDLNIKINQLFDNNLPSIQLQFSKVFDEVTRINSIWKDIKVINETTYPITVDRTSLDIEYQQFDEYLKTSNVEKIKNIKSNSHIDEAVNIINDLKN